MVCMVLGLGFEWCFLLADRDRADKERTRRLLVYGTLIAMVVWLFVQANSVTAQSCFMVATAFLFATATRTVAKRPWVIYLLVGVLVAVPFATLFMGVGGGALEGMGRDSTLTGRTDIWRQIISMGGNPIFGTGFESFWLGDRVSRLWQVFDFHPTQAHNGYIEVYLELGWIGILLLAAIVVTGYRNAIAMFRWMPEAGSIRLAFILVGLVYNFTEAGFRMMTFTWFFFLISTVVVPKAVEQASSSLPPDRFRKFDEWQAEGDPVSSLSRRRLEAI